MYWSDLSWVNTSHPVKTHGFGYPHRFPQSFLIAHITKHRINRLNSGCPSSIHQHGSGKEGLFPFQGSLRSNISGIVFQPHGQAHIVFTGSSYVKGVENTSSTFQNRHKVDVFLKPFFLKDGLNSGFHGKHLVRCFCFG